MITTFKEHYSRLYGELCGESITESYAMSEYVEPLGSFILQGHQLEEALIRLVEAAKIITSRPPRKMTAGTLRTALEGRISQKDMKLLSSAIAIRNKVIHGRLNIGLSDTFSPGDYQDIGVTTWSHLGESQWIDCKRAN